MIHVCIQCKTECKTYYKGKVIEIKDYSYPEVVPDFIIYHLDPPSDVIAISNFFNPVCKLMKEKQMYNRKHLCLYHLFKGKCEDVKDILCPDECNDKKN